MVSLARRGVCRIGHPGSDRVIGRSPDEVDTSIRPVWEPSTGRPSSSVRSDWVRNLLQNAPYDPSSRWTTVAQSCQTPFSADHREPQRVAVVLVDVVHAEVGLPERFAVDEDPPRRRDQRFQVGQRVEALREGKTPLHHLPHHAVG